MNDHDLDQLFAQARAETSADAKAAERFLRGHRARQQYRRQVRAGWVSALLASAAVVTGLVVLRPTPELPTSTAYQSYESAMGDGW